MFAFLSTSLRCERHFQQIHFFLNVELENENLKHNLSSGFPAQQNETKYSKRRYYERRYLI